MRRFLLLALLTAATLSALATATEHHPIGVMRPTHFTEDLSVDGFDSANGDLRAVSLCYRYKHIRSVRAESFDAATATVDVSFQPGWLELRSENDVIMNFPFPAEQETYDLTEFDGVIDYHGSSGIRFRTVRHGNGIVHITDPAIVNRFLDVPTASITAQGFDLFSASGAGNLDAQSVSRVIIQGEVIYNN